MRQHGTLASAVVVVLLTGIVSAGAKTGILSGDKGPSDTMVRQTADSTAGGGAGGGTGKSDRAEKKSPTGLRR